MPDTLNTIQQKIASLVDQSTTPPTAGSGEWNLRTMYINRALEEWANSYDWSALRKTIWLGSGVSGATIAMPSNFRKVAAFPKYFGNITGGEDWAEIQFNETGLYDTNDHYYYLLGDRGNGFSMIWNPGTLSSGASVRLDYYAFPASLASPADVTECPDPEYLADRTISYVLESRSDARFQEMEAKAREKLLQMIDNENAKSVAYQNDVKTPERLYYGFRIGK